MENNAGRGWVVPLALLMVLITGPRAAKGGIEEHNPLPTSEEMEMLVLDDGFWESVDEESRSASQSDPSTDLNGATLAGSTGWLEHENQAGVAESWALEQNASFAGRLGELSPEQEDFARLKWKLATVGVDLMTEQELENLRAELEETGVIDPDENPTLEGDLESLNGGASAGSQGSGSESESESDDAEAEEETGAKSGALLGEMESESTTEGGCAQSGTTGWGQSAFWSLFLLALLRSREKNTIDAL